MALEDLVGPDKFLDALVIANPAGGDPKSQGDDHLRGVKNTLQNTFPSLDGAVDFNAADMTAGIEHGLSGEPVGMYPTETIDLAALASNQLIVELLPGYDYDFEFSQAMPSIANSSMAGNMSIDGAAFPINEFNCTLYFGSGQGGAVSLQAPTAAQIILGGSQDGANNQGFGEAQIRNHDRAAIRTNVHSLFASAGLGAAYSLTDAICTCSFDRVHTHFKVNWNNAATWISGELVIFRRNRTLTYTTPDP